MNAPPNPRHELPRPKANPDLALAHRHAPRIRFDSREPFLPAAVGITVFHQDGPSPSFPRKISFPHNAKSVIEYAIWWDWDIQHLYELEHIWLYLDTNERLLAADASWHGEWFSLHATDGDLPRAADGRLCLFSEPGKHAFATTTTRLKERRPITERACGPRAGALGLHVTPLFATNLRSARTADSQQLVHTWLERRRFQPSYDFSKEFALEDAPFFAWPTLAEWIPRRCQSWLGHLEASIPRGERRVLRVGHRGASAHETENTLAAFAKAAALGCDMVEMDLRYTADSVPVILHDDSLRRTFGPSRPIADLNWSEARVLAPDLPSLEEAVIACKEHELGLYLEVKSINPDSGARALEILREQNYLRQSIIASFRVDWLAGTKRLCPELPISVLFGVPNVDAVALARAVGAEYVHPCWDNEPDNVDLMTEEWLAAVHAAGLGIFCWVQLSRDSAARLRAKGVHAMTADDPLLLLE